MSPTQSPATGPSCASIFLPNASIVIGSGENQFDVRALVDPCCPGSRIHGSLAKALNHSVTRSRSSKMARQPLMLVDDHMQTRTPAKPLDPKVRDGFQDITLADDRCFHPSLVSAVLGADVYAELILPGLLPSQNGLPLAQSSPLGWLLQFNSIQFFPLRGGGGSSCRHVVMQHRCGGITSLCFRTGWNRSLFLRELQGEFQSKQDFFNLAPSSGAIYMSTGALESAIVYRSEVIAF